MPEELWTEVCNIVQEVANKTTSKEKKKCIKNLNSHMMPLGLWSKDLWVFIREFYGEQTNIRAKYKWLESLIIAYGE